MNGRLAFATEISADDSWVARLVLVHAPATARTTSTTMQSEARDTTSRLSAFSGHRRERLVTAERPRFRHRESAVATGVRRCADRTRRSCSVVTVTAWAPGRRRAENRDERAALCATVLK